MAWFSSMSGLLSTVVLVLVLLEGTKSSGSQGAAVKSELTSGYWGTWSGGSGQAARAVWAAKGSSVVLPCRLGQQGAEAAGDDWLNVTWQRNNDTIESDRRHLFKQRHLNITKVVHRRGRVTDEGEYRCLILIRNSKGIVTSPPTNLYTATLSKKVVVSPTNVSVVEGESVRLTCQIDSHPPANLTWVRDQQSLPQDDRYTNPISGVLQINKVQQADSGSYKCLAENLLAVKKPRRSEGVILRVLTREGETYKAPSFLSPKDPVTVIQGQDVTIECFASGWPIPSLSWQRKLNVSQSTVWEAVVAGVSAGIIFVSPGMLRLTNAEPKSHAGTYRCTATNTNPNNQLMTIVSQDIPLDVLTPPVITEPPSQLVTVTAKTARLNCSASGHPPPHVTWYIGGKPVPIKGRILQHTSNQLVFTNSITSDTGLYQCLAVNDAGYASSWAFMYVNSSKNQPDPPQNLQYVLLSPSSVLLSWDPVNPASGQVLKAYSIRYNEIDSGAMDQHAVSQNTSHLLERLKADTNYTAQVRAYSNHASEPSEPLYFRTREDVPSGAPTLHLAATSPTSLLVMWNKLPQEKAGGKIIGYKIYWRKRKETYYYNLHEVGEDVFKYEITGLHPGKKYEVRVLAGTSVGYPNPKDDNNWPWEAQKLPDRSETNTPAAPLITVKMLNETDNNATKNLAAKVDWTLPLDNKAEVLGFYLKYKHISGPWSSSVDLKPNVSSYVITGLESDYYQVQVWAYNDEVEGQPGTEEFQTHPVTHLTPTIEKLEVNPLSQTSVHMSWSVNQEGISYYTIKYQQVAVSGSLEPKTMKSEIEEIIVPGLKPLSNYEFSVRAHTSETTFGPFCPPVQATTIGIRPPAPKNFDYLPTDASTIKLIWSLPEESIDVINRYEVFYSMEKSAAKSFWTLQEVEGEVTDAIVTGLVSNTEYWFKMRGCTVKICSLETPEMPAIISAILPPDLTPAPQDLYLIFGLVGALLVLLIVGLLTCYVFKFCQGSDVPPRHLACNGNGHINGKRGPPRGITGQGQGMGDGDGQEMEVYIPMLTQIPPDFKSPPLDTKGGYPDHQRVNGINNPRCNGFMKNRDHLRPTPQPESHNSTADEQEGLVVASGSSNKSSTNGAVVRCEFGALSGHERLADGRDESLSGGNSPDDPPLYSPQHNHSYDSNNWSANVTTLTTLNQSVELSPQEPTVASSQHNNQIGSKHAPTHNVNHNHNHHNYNHHSGGGATRTTSPRPGLTIVQ